MATKDEKYEKFAKEIARACEPKKLLESEEFWQGVREGFLVCAGYYLRDDERQKHGGMFGAGVTKTFKEMTDEEFEAWFISMAEDHKQGTTAYLKK